MRQEVGFEEYLEHINGPPSRLFLKLCSCTRGLFEELDRHMKRGVSQECPNCVACKESVEHVLFECVSYNSQRQIFLDYLRQILTLDAFEAFIYGIVFWIKLYFV